MQKIYAQLRYEEEQPTTPLDDKFFRNATIQTGSI